MALTAIQRDVCRRLAAQRVASGESYVAGGVALNAILATPRRSDDIDLFHDTEEALAASWDADRRLLVAAGYGVEVLRERPSFIEARVSLGAPSVVLQWARDSAFRFFPLVEHADFGLTLHAFDLATNKVLALVGRVEVRDWVDVIECDRRLQPLGYLAWAACGKDPGFSPVAILAEAARTARYSASEVASLAFEGDAPDAGELARAWHAALGVAREMVALLPAAEVGKVVLTAGGELFRGDPDALRSDLGKGRLRFHQGRIGGAFPMPVGASPGS